MTYNYGILKRGIYTLKTEHDKKRTGRLLVIIEAAVEYFIHLCVTSTFLTAILNDMDVTASLQGIIGAIASLTCSVQLISVFWVKKTYPCKRWVSLLNLLSQLLFVILYIIPMTSLSSVIRVSLFMVLLFAAYACQYYLTPSRVSWQMSLVSDNQRGSFTAKKEIVSLIGGMLFSQGAGIMLDYFKAKGDMRTCFTVFAVTITVLSLLHLFIMLWTHEPEPQVQAPSKSFSQIIDIVFRNPDVRRTVIFEVLFMAGNVSLNFQSVYATRTLGLSYTYITAIAILHSLFRAVVSPFLGRIADRRSWAYMLRICLAVLIIGYVAYTLCTPENALWVYPIFMICYGFSLGGTNAAKTNLCLDYVAKEDRRYVLGIQSALGGISGFLLTLLASLLVDNIEKNGNTLLGFSVYPQQILFAVSAAVLLLLVLFFLPKLGTPKRIDKARQELLSK